MTTLLQRFNGAFKAFANPAPVQAEKSYSPWFGMGAGLTSRNRDFQHNEYGAALASQLIPEIQAALNVYAIFLGGLTWQVKDRATDEIYQDSSRIDIDPAKPGARFMKAIQASQRRTKHNYWKSLVYSDLIAGESYVYRPRNQSQIPTDLQWLNPLNTEPVEVHGRIQYYQYMGLDSQDTGYRIDERDMAYRMYQRNIFNDLRGHSPILTIIEESNLSNNVKRAFGAYFKNGMSPGGVLAPDSDEVWSGTELDRVRRDLFKNHKGVQNFENWILSQRKLSVQTFDGKDAGKDFEVLASLRQTIMLALGVSEELAGMPTNATYENLDASQRNFYKMRGIPYVQELANFHNTQILPYLEPNQSIYLEADVSKYETERPEIITQDANAGFIDFATAQQKRGYDPDEDLRNIYIIAGRPIHKETILRMAMMIPGEELAYQAESQETAQDTTGQPVSALDTFLSDIAPVADTTQNNIEERDVNPVIELTEKSTHGESCTCSVCNHDKLYAGDTLYPDEDEITSRIDEALQTWKRYAQNRYSKKSIFDFETDVIPDYIRRIVVYQLDNITDKSDIKTVFNGLLNADIVKTRRGYRTSIRRLARGFWNGDLSEFQFTDGMNSAIQREYSAAFAEGVKRGGLTMDDLTPNERAVLDDLIAEEVQNAFSLMLDLRDSKKGDGGKLGDIRKRIDRWVARYDRVEIRGYVIASRDKKLMWKVSPATESCKDCLMLNGRVYRASTWAGMNIEPASPRLECFGLHCGCILIETDEPVTKGRPPKFG